jgi:hypothetical protein
MSSVSSWLALYGHSIPVIQPDQGQRYANVVPVDYLAQSIIRSIPKITYLGDNFILPLAQVANSVASPSMPGSKRSSWTSMSNDSSVASINYFPHIFNVSTNIEPISWYQAYTAIQDYWSRPNNTVQASQKLPEASNYFSTNKTLSKARFLMQYYFRSTNNNNTKSSSNNPNLLLINNNGQMMPFLNKSDLMQHHDQQKLMELASNIRNNLAKQNRQPWQCISFKFNELMNKAGQNNIDVLKDLDWYNYFMQSCYGVHRYIMHSGSHLRTSVLAFDQDCALYSTAKNNNTTSMIDVPFRSVIYTEEEMRHRIQHMIDITISSLRNPAQSIQDEKQWKPMWIEYLNDTLEDWCDEGSIESRDITSRKKEIQNRWKLRVDENSESTKVTVLNNAQVGEAIHQV